MIRRHHLISSVNDAWVYDSQTSLTSAIGGSWPVDTRLAHPLYATRQEVTWKELFGILREDGRLHANRRVVICKKMILAEWAGWNRTEENGIGKELGTIWWNRRPKYGGVR